MKSKVNWRIILIFITLFVIVSILTGTWESGSCGEDIVGFPLTFFTYTESKRIVPSENTAQLSYINLTIDLLIFFVGAILIDKLIKRIKGRTK